MRLPFVYGKDKPFHFHSSAWRERVKQHGGQVVAADSGHRVPRHPELNDILERLLDSTDRQRAA